MVLRVQQNILGLLLYFLSNSIQSNQSNFLFVKIVALNMAIWIRLDSEILFSQGWTISNLRPKMIHNISAKEFQYKNAKYSLLNLNRSKTIKIVK